MNIMKTNMLLLDNKRIMKEDAGNTTAQAPVPAAEDSQKAMNALTFQGMKNVMANPELSSKLGNVANTANKGLKNSAVKGMMLISTLLPAAMLTSSCGKDLKSENSVSVTVNVDVASLIALAQQLVDANLMTLEELKQLRQDLANWQTNQDAYNQVIISMLTKMGNDIIGIGDKVDEGNAYHLVVINLLESQGYSHSEAVTLLQKVIDLVTKYGKSYEEAMQELINQLQNVNQKLDTIISNQDRAYDEQVKQTNILKSINKNTAETAKQAKEANVALRNATKTMIDCNNSLLAKLDKIDTDMNKGFEATAKEIGMSTQQLLSYMKKMNIDIQNSNAWNAMMIKLAIDYANVKNQEKLDALIAEEQASRADAKEYAENMLNIVDNTNKKLDLLASLINKYGSKLSATANAALAELIKGNIKQDRANYLLKIILMEVKDLDANVEAKLQAILDKIGTGNISQEDIDAIISLLQNIDTNVASIKNTVDEIYNLLKTEQKKNDVFRTQMLINGHINTQIAMDNNRQLRENNKTLSNIEGYLADLNTKVDSLITLGNTKPDELKAEIARLRQENSAWLAKIDIDQNMGTAAIIAKLRDFQNTYINTESQEIKLQKQQNGMMQYAIYLLKNKNSDNTAVLNALQEVINAINSGKEDITAELKAANEKLDALLQKVGLILDDMGKLISTIKVYGDEILKKLDANQATQDSLLKYAKERNILIKINNMNQDELLKEVKGVKPLIQDLSNKATTANSYLEMIAKKQIEMDQHIQNIDNGNGISAEELDSLWNIHDAKAFAKAKAYMDALHIEDMTKADTIIALMKQGNTTADNTYKLVLNLINKADSLKPEELKALLTAIYEYLPKLICNCQCKSDCDDNATHEGRIGDLLD